MLAYILTHTVTVSTTHCVWTRTHCKTYLMLYTYIGTYTLVYTVADACSTYLIPLHYYCTCHCTCYLAPPHTHYVVDIHQPSILMYVLLAVLLVDTYLKVHTC